MLWSTLFTRIGKQPLHITQHHHVYALLNDPKTNKTRKVWLCLKYDNAGRPYLVEDFALKERLENRAYTKNKKH